MNPQSPTAPSAAPVASDKQVRRGISFSGGPVFGAALVAVITLCCITTLPWMFSSTRDGGAPRYNEGSPREGRLPPWWWPARPDAALRIAAMTDDAARAAVAAKTGLPKESVADSKDPLVQRELMTRSTYARERARYLLGTDSLGRSLFFRCLAGGGLSLIVGIAAAAISVIIGTLYGALAGYAGGRFDAFLMRVVDVLYGLPYVLLVVLLAVAADSLSERYARSRIESTSQLREHYVETELLKFEPALRTEDLRRQLADEAMEQHGSGELGTGVQNTLGLATLLVAIGGVSWLTMARVVRGQVLSLRNQPFVEAARSIGASPSRIFVRHLLPNLVGPITVYATLTVPQAILQESFLSFLGIGVKPPLPSWGGLASEGLSELNPYQSDWWLLLFPCLLLAVTLLALNFVGEWFRERFDPRGRRR